MLHPAPAAAVPVRRGGRPRQQSVGAVSWFLREESFESLGSRAGRVRRCVGREARAAGLARTGGVASTRTHRVAARRAQKAERARRRAVPRTKGTSNGPAPPLACVLPC